MISSQRVYNMTDAELCMFTSNLVGTMTRDQTEFTARGVTALMVTAMETLGNAFEVFQSDAYYYADYIGATETKNTHREACTVKLRAIMSYFKIKFGPTSSQVRKFDAGDMTKQDDKKFLMTCRFGVGIAREYLTDLTSVGLTAAMIDDLEDTAQLMEDAMNEIATAQETRDIKAVERITKGNELYALVSRYCEIGKYIWEDVNEAKYNDYVIYGGTGSGLSAPTGFDGIFGIVPTPHVDLTWDIVSGATSYDIFVSQVEIGQPEGTYSLQQNIESAPASMIPIPDKLYYFYAVAKNDTQTSAHSSTISVSTVMSS